MSAIKGFDPAASNQAITDGLVKKINDDADQKQKQAQATAQNAGSQVLQSGATGGMGGTAGTAVAAANTDAPDKPKQSDAAKKMLGMS